MTDVTSDAGAALGGPRRCDASIHPFPVGNDTEINCDVEGDHRQHSGVLRDYAYPGSTTTMEWADHDRRSFRGAWPGRCQDVDRCSLPNGHVGKCAP